MSAKKSFTLIEILIAIGIIAVIATIVFVNISSARRRTKNSKVASDLTMIKNALQQYYRDTGTVPYNPRPGRSCIIGEPDSNDPGNPNKGCLVDLVNRGYIAKLPTLGPLENSKCGLLVYSKCYRYYNYGNFVTLFAQTDPPEYGPFPYGWHCSAIVTTSANYLGGWWSAIGPNGEGPGDPSQRMYCDGFLLN